MDNTEVVYLYLDDIIPNRFQPREVFDEQALKELAVSIKEHGVIQPIIVRKVDNKYEIIAGERRYKASTMAGLVKIPAIVKNLDDKESSKVALIENLQRRDLTPIEEARTYQKILELEDNMTQEELAATMGKTQSSVSNKLRLLALPDEVQDALLNEKISERHARSLLNIDNANDQVKMLNKVIEEKLTVRELDKLIKGEKDEPSINIGESVTGSPVETSSPSGALDGQQEEPVISELVEAEAPAEPVAQVEKTVEAVESTPPEPKVAEPADENDANINALIRDISDNDDSSSGGKSAVGGLESLDLSNLSNPFDKPGSTDKVVEENETVASTIETPKLNIPNLTLNLGGLPASTETETAQPATTQAAPSGGSGDYQEALNSIKNVVEPFKQSGVVKDYKEFEFGNYVTLTIRINKK